MSEAKRILYEHAVQAFGIVVSLLDRLVLTGVLLRTWSVVDFESWSVLGAVAGLLTLFEFGFNLYFSNRLMIEVEQGNRLAAERILAVANLVFLLCGVTALFVGLSAPRLGWCPLPASPPADWLIALAMLCASTAFRISTCGSMALYRANRQFARLSLILGLSEAARVVCTTAAVLLGGGLLHAAAASFGVIFVGQVLLVVVDAMRRFYPHRWEVKLPTGKEITESAVISAGYFAQSVPLVLLMHAPVIMLSSLDAGEGAVAGFVLSRTLTGLPRAILQTLGVVVGQECSRHLARRDFPYTFKTFNRGARAFAVFSGLAAGFLLAYGAAIAAKWTSGRSDLLTWDLLLAGLAPMFLAPVSVLTHNVLACANTPALSASGRWLQLLVTIMAARFLPIQDLAMRTLVAMSLGEIIGFAPASYFGTALLIPGTSIRFHLRIVAASVLSGFIGYSAAAASLYFLPSTPPLGPLCLAMSAAALVCTVAFLVLGVDETTRASLHAACLGLLCQRKTHLRN